MSLFDRFRSSRPFPDAEEATISDGGGKEVSPSSTEQLSSDAFTFDGAVREGGRAYNPYEGLSAMVDRRQQHSFKIPEKPEFVFAEEAIIKRRSWNENVVYYTGSGYLGGALAGGGIGFVQGLRTEPPTGHDTARLRLNRLLNSSGRIGRMAGNNLGVVGFYFAMFENLCFWAQDKYMPYMPEVMPSIGAGFLTGLLFRSTRGPRAAAITGGVGAAAATGLCLLRRLSPGL